MSLASGIDALEFSTIDAIVDGSNIYPDITSAGITDVGYAGYQAPLKLERIDSGIPAATSQSFLLLGGKIPYNVTLLGSLPDSFTPNVMVPLITSGIFTSPTGVPVELSNTVAGDFARWNISPSGDPGDSFGITRYLFYDFEGERIEVRDFILNPKIRDAGVASSPISLDAGTSKSLTFYAGFSESLDSSFRENSFNLINWDILDSTPDGILSLENTQGPVATIISNGTPGTATLRAVRGGTTDLTHVMGIGSLDETVTINIV